MTYPIPVGKPALPSLRLQVGRATPLHGERLAVVGTAAAVAMLPLLVPRGPANVTPVDALIFVALLLCVLWAGSSGHRFRLPYAIPMGLFLAGGALAALAGPVPTTGLVALAQDIVLLAWCWAVFNLSLSPERLRIVLATWVYAAVAWTGVLFTGLATGSSVLTGQQERQGGRTALTFLDPNVSANYYVISLMLVWATQRPRRRPFRVAAYSLLLAAVFTTGSNSGIVSLIVGAIVAIVISVYRRQGMVAAVAASCLLAIAGSLLASTVSLRSIQERAYDSRWTFVRDGLGRGEKSVEQRGMLLEESMRLYRAGGPLGQGPVSTKSRLEADMAPFVKEAHNDYFAALTERGVLGLLGLLVLVSGLVLRAATLARARLSAGFTAVVTRPNAVIGALAGTLVAGTVYELLHVRHVWALFAIVAALYAWGRE